MRTGGPSKLFHRVKETPTHLSFQQGWEEADERVEVTTSTGRGLRSEPLVVFLSERKAHIAQGFPCFTVLPVSHESPDHTIHTTQCYADLEMVNLWDIYLQFLLWPSGFVKRPKNRPGLKDPL